MTVDKKIKTKLNMMYFIAYAGLACYSPFLIVYFKYRNLDFTQIGVMFATLSIVGVISQPVWGYITDKFLDARATLIIVMLCSGISIFTMTFASDFYTVLISMVLIAVFQSSLFPILDAFCYKIASEQDSIQYGKVRIRGSLGYALTVVLSGAIIKYTNITIPFYLYCALMLAGIIIMSTINYKVKTYEQRINVKDVVNLFKERRFLIFILSVTLLNIALGANVNYIGELMKQTGGDVSNLGFLWFIIATSEIPVIYLSSRILSRFKDLHLYYLGIIFYLIRFFADSLCTSWEAVIAVQALQSVSFALYITATLHFLNRIIKPTMKTSGITIYAAITGGIGGFIGNLGGGIIVGTFGIFWLYRILVVICVLALFTGLFIEKDAKYKELYPVPD